MKPFLILLFTSLCLVAKAQKNNIAVKYANTIRAKELKEKLSILAGPGMEGRETATEGERKAAAFIEEHFKNLGLRPGNVESYRQPWNIYRDSLATASLEIYGLSFSIDNHFSISAGKATNGSYSINDFVFAGFGIVDSVTNDYNQLDVSGKWVMIIEGTPADINKSASSRWVGSAATPAKIIAAQARGAIGVLVVSKTFPSTKASLGRGGAYQKQSQAGFNTVAISYHAAASMLTRQLNEFADLLNIRPGLFKTNIQLTLDKSTATLNSSNVLGVIEGTDKKDEYVFITAHYDHLGIHDGQIYYGADDDGSGSVSVIEIAEAFAQAKKEGNGPRRTVVFMTVSGEEKGLLGSEYYGNNPIFPLSKTTADLNIDMVGRIDPKYKGDSLNYLYVIGDDKLSSDLRPITDSVNENYSRLELDRKYTDVNDPNRFYYRSDHYNFAKHGVPVIFYFNGTHADYHKPTDTVDKINFNVMEKRVRFVFHTAWVIANLDRMLNRDKVLNIPSR